MSSRVTDSDECLEPRALTGRRLLLDGHNLHDLILEFVLEEIVNDLSLVDRKRKEEDLFNASNLPSMSKQQLLEQCKMAPLARILQLKSPESLMLSTIHFLPLTKDGSTRSTYYRLINPAARPMASGMWGPAPSSP
jgi:hypothetical protein